MKTFWLSFCDARNPAGSQFLGACVVDISDEEMEEQRDTLWERFPHAQPGAEWIAAASRKAWEMGCNPGGEMMIWELPVEDAEYAARIAAYPRNRLLQKNEMRQPTTMSNE